MLIDYSKQPEQFHTIVRGGTGDTSKDNWISFWAPDDKFVCALDLSHVKTYCADYADSQRNLPYGKIDFTLISKGTDRTSGKRYVMIMAPPAMGVFSVDMANGVLKPEFRGPESPERPGNNNGVCDPGERCYFGSHVDTLEDSGGIQYLVEDRESGAPCEVAVNTFQLNTGVNMLKQVELGGGRKKVMTLWRCGRGWVDEHVGCAKSAPYCVISTQAEGRSREDVSEAVPTPHANELIVIRENGLEIRRLALTRTVYYNGANNYMAAPRAALSSDGSAVIMESNFGQFGKPRVVMVETGYGKPRLPRDDPETMPKRHGTLPTGWHFASRGQVSASPHSVAAATAPGAHNSNGCNALARSKVRDREPQGRRRVWPPACISVMAMTRQHPMWMQGALSLLLFAATGICSHPRDRRPRVGAPRREHRAGFGGSRAQSGAGSHAVGQGGRGRR